MIVNGIGVDSLVLVIDKFGNVKAKRVAAVDAVHITVEGDPPQRFAHMTVRELKVVGP